MLTAELEDWLGAAVRLGVCVGLPATLLLGVIDTLGVRVATLGLAD
jgi:hypothetical protein